MAHALHPNDDQAAGEAAGPWCHQLKHEGGRALHAALAAVDLRGTRAEARERHRQVLGYVESNLYRMDYPRYQANGWLIGSGHVESAGKGVVGQRLKGNGMRWSEAGADAVGHPRALFKSEKGTMGRRLGPRPVGRIQESHQLKRRLPRGNTWPKVASDSVGRRT